MECGSASCASRTQPPSTVVTSMLRCMRNEWTGALLHNCMVTSLPKTNGRQQNGMYRVFHCA